VYFTKSLLLWHAKLNLLLGNIDRQFIFCYFLHSQMKFGGKLDGVSDVQQDISLQLAAVCVLSTTDARLVEDEVEI